MLRSCFYIQTFIPEFSYPSRRQHRTYLAKNNSQFYKPSCLLSARVGRFMTTMLISVLSQIFTLSGAHSIGPLFTLPPIKILYSLQHSRIHTNLPLRQRFTQLRRRRTRITYKATAIPERTFVYVRHSIRNAGFILSFEYVRFQNLHQLTLMDIIGARRYFA